LLNKTLENDLRLWLRVRTIYNFDPTELLPPGMTIFVDETQEMYSNINSQGPTSNWGRSFCQKFAALVCNPFFHGEQGLKLFRYALAAVVHYWNGSGTAPNEKSLGTYRQANRAFDAVDSVVEFQDVEDGLLVCHALKRKFGLDMPPEWEFTRYIPDLAQGRNFSDK